MTKPLEKVNSASATQCHTKSEVEQRMQHGVYLWLRDLRPPAQDVPAPVHAAWGGRQVESRHCWALTKDHGFRRPCRLLLGLQGHRGQE